MLRFLNFKYKNLKNEQPLKKKERKSKNNSNEEDQEVDIPRNIDQIPHGELPTI